MPQPSVTTVTIDGDKFDALTANVSFSTASDSSGMPMMGSFNSSIEIVVDLHDNKNMPFATVKKLFELSKVVTKDKIKDVKIEFWQDENRQDVLCSYAFKGWISHWHNGSGGGRGPKGSDGCIVPAVNEDRLKLTAAIKNHPGTVLRVVNPYFIPEGRILPPNIA